ncbi:MAG: DUF2934 domain-containing protein [Dehalococcoidales bacterium]|nr:DUF2934 domain-containing protein [Dehalococcoidales bacterium]
MATEEEIRKLAYEFWEQEGRPSGKDGEHYFRAQKTLELKEIPSVIELPASSAAALIETQEKAHPKKR